MNVLLLLPAVLTIFAAGFGIHMLLSRRIETDLGETFGMSWLLGAGFVSITLALLGLIARGVILQLVVTGLCLLLGACGIRHWRGKAPQPPTLFDQMLIALFFGGCGLACFACWRDAFVWDGVLIWEAKARFAFLHGGTLPASYFSDASRLWSHPDYPLLLPLTETWVYLWLGDCDQFWIKFLFPVFYAAGAALLYSGIARAAGNCRAGLLAAIAFFFLPYPCFGDWGLLQGYADFPLGITYLAAAISLEEFQRDPTNARAGRWACSAALLPWIKNEGAILWAVLLLLAFCRPALRRWRWWWLPMPGLIVWGGWKLALHLLHAVADVEFMPLTFANFRQNLPRLPAITQELLGQLLDWREWSVLWIGFAAALFFALLNMRHASRTSRFSLFAAVLIPLILEAGIFLFSIWPSPEKYLDHVHTALPRLVFQLTPLAALVIGQSAARAFSRDV